MGQVLGIFWIGNVHKRSSIGFLYARDRVHLRSGVMTDIGNVAAVLVNDDRLISLTTLQVIPSGEFRVPSRLLIGRFRGGLVGFCDSSIGDHGDLRGIRRAVVLLRHE